MAKTKRIAGIDPGSINTGWAVLDVQGGSYKHVASGVFRLGTGEVAGRLAKLHQDLAQVLADYAPDEFAIEQAFMNRNADSALKLGQARGVALCVAALQALPVAEYAPRSVKQSVVGNGAANKHQVQQMVSSLLGLPVEDLQADQADAIAVALCHAHYRSLGPLVDAAGTSQLRKGRQGKRARGWSAWRSYGETS